MGRVVEHADAAAAEAVVHRHDVRAQGRVDARDGVAVEVLGVEPAGHQPGLALAVDVGVGREPQLPADGLRLPERHEVAHVAADPGMGEVGVPAALLEAAIDVQRLGLVGLQVDLQEQLVPQAVGVQVVHLVVDSPAVGLDQVAVGAVLGLAFAVGRGAGRPVGIDQGHGQDLVAAQHRQLLGRQHHRAGDAVLVQVVDQPDLHPLGRGEGALRVPGAVGRRGDAGRARAGQKGREQHAADRRRHPEASLGFGGIRTGVA